jgi:hypothetical protein
LGLGMSWWTDETLTIAPGRPSVSIPRMACWAERNEPRRLTLITDGFEHRLDLVLVGDVSLHQEGSAPSATGSWRGESG